MHKQIAKILIVDDRQENLHAMKMTLSPLDDVEIFTCLDGNQALSLMLEHEFAVVLMDVQMPEMDGFETAALMQNHPATKNIPIIFVTAISKDEEHVYKGYESGAVDYLFKPVNHEILLSKVNVFLNLYRQRLECEQMQKEIQKIRNLEALGVLAGGIAHDFNNLMTAVFANVELAKLRSEPGGKVSEMLEDTLKAAEQTRQLTQQLVIFSKSDLSTREEVNILDLLNECCDMYLQDSAVELIKEFNLNKIFIKVDRNQFCQVFRNVIQNAKDAMPSGGTIRIVVDGVHTVTDNLPAHLRDGSYIRIKFEDNGPGIAQEVLGSIFDPYFSTKEKGAVRGQGLGLTIVHSIVRKHGGYVTAQSALGRGTVLSIYLPREEKKKRPVTEKPESVPVLNKTPGKRRVLVLEDEEMLAKVLSEMLDCLGCDSHIVEECSEAVAIYSQARESGNPFDGVILESMIRGGGRGDKVLQELKAIDPQVKALAFSDYMDDRNWRNYKEIGFEGIIKKPFTLSALADGLTYFD